MYVRAFLLQVASRLRSRTDLANSEVVTIVRALSTMVHWASAARGPGGHCAASRCEAFWGQALACADLREDQQINPAPEFLVDFRPSGPAAGRGSPENGSGSKDRAGYIQNRPGNQFSGPFVGVFFLLAFGVGHKSQ